MQNATGPSKEKVREWLVARHLYRVPLPAPQQIREQLGWEWPKQPPASRNAPV